MKYCTNCGARIPDNANFCPSCGTRFGAAPQPPYQQPYQQPQYQQPYQQPAPQKMSYMDKVRAAREAQKQKNGQIKWWMWALIGIGTAILIALNPLGLS